MLRGANLSRIGRMQNPPPLLVKWTHRAGFWAGDRRCRLATRTRGPI